MVKVIFRKYEHIDQVIAVFPEHPGDMYGYMVTTFMHLGQHGAGYYSQILQNTIPATEEDYADLMRELETRGYENLEVYKRETPQMIERRRELSKQG